MAHDWSFKRASSWVHSGLACLHMFMDAGTMFPAPLAEPGAVWVAELELSQGLSIVRQP